MQEGGLQARPRKEGFTVQNAETVTDDDVICSGGTVYTKGKKEKVMEV
jgi:hypothetical protein